MRTEAETYKLVIEQFGSTSKSTLSFKMGKANV